MKILALNASHRGNQGHTRFLVDKLAKGATDGGAQFEVVTLAELKINRCLSCGKCNTREHYLRCVYDDKDDVRGVFNRMAEADIIVFATPVYVFSMPGLLKTFLDRLYATGDVFDLRLTKSGMFFHHLDPDICSKPIVALICCDNTEKETPQNLISYFRTYAKFHDAPLAGLLVRNAGRFAGHGRDPGAFERAPRLAAAYQAFEQAGYELATTGRVKPSTQKAASQNIIPMPPLIRLLKNFQPVKRKMLEQARKMTRFANGDV
ncbi:MAG: flavodoxin family protein [Proteobacteria bacterium]|nr:flavodoxin family protein [Pseudomonadota bacterium]